MERLRAELAATRADLQRLQTDQDAVRLVLQPLVHALKAYPPTAMLVDSAIDLATRRAGAADVAAAAYTQGDGLVVALARLLTPPPGAA